MNTNNQNIRAILSYRNLESAQAIRNIKSEYGNKGINPKSDKWGLYVAGKAKATSLLLAIKAIKAGAPTDKAGFRKFLRESSFLETAKTHLPLAARNDKGKRNALLFSAFEQIVLASKASPEELAKATAFFAQKEQERQARLATKAETVAKEEPKGFFRKLVSAVS